MIRTFPDIGAAWEPPIPSPLIWATTMLVAALAAPLIWRLVLASRLQEQGARWATTSDLQRAGLLLTNRTTPHSLPETLEEMPNAD